MDIRNPCRTLRGRMENGTLQAETAWRVWIDHFFAAWASLRSRRPGDGAHALALRLFGQGKLLFRIKRFRIVLLVVLLIKRFDRGILFHQLDDPRVLALSLGQGRREERCTSSAPGAA